ncbi:CHC2 zinc finger domain-containing protein [Chitinophaga barathri]|uniref:Zinc finger CHC2-type domain-containing protein n=1 Tax=Chitinophaga barathri TaxID=1647451 RepID=A0A3N4MKL0_9BACT|nr:CHC2 zinc finger domain-containing protein [Chitinophaga barathri]RPD40610.1 hypothetical protein EG028_15030 [Chitinophaga barathri]
MNHIAETITLAQILEKLGHAPVRTSGHDLYYLSPLREEKTASFHVNTDKNVWYDHGTGEGGGIIKFVQRYLQTQNVGNDEGDAKRWIKNMFGFAPIINPVKDLEIPKYDKKLHITSEQDIERPALIRYLDSRGIPLPLAQKYLKQINVYNRETSKSIYALGFKNDKGGHEIRNKYFKGSTSPKYITFIRGTVIKPEEVHIFEGWPDYLTAIIYDRDGQKFKGDAIILNSLANLSKATGYIKGYGYRHALTWMHNDQPGIEATANLDAFFKTEEDLTHRPMNGIYAPYKDLNAWHTVKIGLGE